MNEEDRRTFEEDFIDIDYFGENWLRYFRADGKRNKGDDWFCPEAFEMTREYGHEIASHGFCHLPFDDKAMSVSLLVREIELAVAVAKSKNLVLETFIYPRNRVAHPEILRDFGFIGYRESLKTLPKVMSLLREGNIFQGAQPHGDEVHGMIRIPPGHFFNWRKGLRAGVPPEVTIARWRSILYKAAEQSRVAHLWFHPHNLISGPKTFDTLREVLAIAADLRADMKLDVQTQADYVKARRREGAPIQVQPGMSMGGIR